ncbi:hypothetical protein B0H66DRAFT_484024 [Apodospora peruviana]|uniref:Uncharacterized protein n=1 Tax=Apodospora peruviana TaxID=516989 RepID=A0AAE0HWL0_9PEZI|nr:hypothetical protein B0H66DRAFT_484024 [Apodospora peruviana]
MKSQIATLFLAALASAGPLAIQRREVPQEHSHNFILDLVRTALAINNPKNIQDPVFALLGNAAAAAGAGLVTNLDCLQMETADQAFTNSKAAGDIPGMAAALLYRALERNTGSVGLASVLCNETAVNPEIAALTQHQDPASADAATINKGIALQLAKLLAAIGADPLLALEAGTFAPGEIGDPTGKGNSCDTDPSDPGCIFSDRLLVLDVSLEEISAAVVGITPTITGTGKFTGTLGGPPPPVVSTAGAARAFSVNGNTFVNIGAAVQRSCDIQHNACANAANSGSLEGGTAQCETQQAECSKANLARRATLDLGSCSNPTIVFKAGLDGRKEESFIAENQDDFNHGSALNIAIIAGFICQRLGDACKAGDEAKAACTSASAAAVATGQNQAAADVFNSILLGGGGAVAEVTTTAAATAAVETAAPTASSVVLTITQCS